LFRSLAYKTRLIRRSVGFFSALALSDTRNTTSAVGDQGIAPTEAGQSIRGRWSDQAIIVEDPAICVEIGMNLLELNY
jgi:hypothetical protein